MPALGNRSIQQMLPCFLIRYRDAHKKKKKKCFYIALYPVRWTFTLSSPGRPVQPFSASLGSILAMQQLRNDYSLTFPPLSIARYSFIQLRRREVKENAQTSMRTRALSIASPAFYQLSYRAPHAVANICYCLCLACIFV